MIPKETPVGTRVRVYQAIGDEANSWTGRTCTTVDDYLTVRSDATQSCFRVQNSHVEPIGARPFVSHKVTCPKCSHEFER